MNQRQIKFNSYIKALHIILTDVDVYANGMIGIEADKLNEQLALTEKYILDDTIYQTIVPTMSGDDDAWLMTVILGQDYIWIEEGQYVLLQYINITDMHLKELYVGDLFKSTQNDILYRIYYVNGGFAINTNVKIWQGDIKKDYPFPLQSLSDEQTVSWIRETCYYVDNYYLNPELLNTNIDVTK